MAYFGEAAQTPQFDAIIISHIHPDHCFDLFPLKYGLMYGSLDHWEVPELWLPPLTQRNLQDMVRSFNGGTNFFDDSFDVNVHNAGRKFNVGPFTVESREVPHFIESYAFRVEVNGVSVAYSGDSGPTPELTELVQGVDLFISEACRPAGKKINDINMSFARSQEIGHMSPEEAAQIAQAAGVHKLMLTHIPQEHDRQKSLVAAQQHFNGPVVLAETFTSTPVQHAVRSQADAS